MSSLVGQHAVPIHHGSPRFHEIEVRPFRITEVRFGGGSRIQPHYHDRPNIGVMLGGSFDLSFGARCFACEPGAVFVEPAGETHCNCMGCGGAWVLAVQPDPADPHVKAGGDVVLSSPGAFHHPQVVHLARRIARESHNDDEFAALMIQGLGFELLALVGRSRAHPPARQPPGWLTRVKELLCDARPRRILLADLAQEAGVHAAHLAREFRVRYGRSPVRFILERRLEWAAGQLATTERPIVEIALDAGFADQSHFTRRFREYAGATPRRFRSARKPRPHPGISGA